MQYPKTKTKPWDHQIEAWNAAKNHDAFYYAADMGCVASGTIISCIEDCNIPIQELFGRTKNIAAKSLCDNKIQYNKIRKTVFSGNRKTVLMKLKSGKQIALTPDHRVLHKIENGKEYWVAAEKLTPGSTVLTEINNSIIIDTVNKIEELWTMPTYDLIMEDPYRNFVANGIIVHNSGKSKMAIDYINGKDCKAVLIICPKSVIPVWPKQFEIHSGKEFRIFAESSSKYSVPKKTTMIQHFIRDAMRDDMPYAVVLNYESFWRKPLGPIFKKFKIIDPGFLRSIGWDVIVADECHRIKAVNGSASWGAMRVGENCRYKLALSGTPMPHEPKDIYAQYRFLDKSIFGTSFTSFRARYCVMGGYENRQVVKYINLDELERKFYSIAHRVKTRDVVDLPEERHEIINCELTPKAMRHYKELEREFVTEINNAEISVDNALVKLLRLSQLTSGFFQPDVNKTEIFDTTKIDTLVDIIQDLPTTEPVVIFCRFTPEIKMLKQAMTKIGRLAGELSGKLNTFADDSTGGKWNAEIYNTMIVQIKSGNAGIDFTASRYGFYLSTGPFTGDYLQSLARLMRPGQKRDVTYYHIHALGTVDVSIFKGMQKCIKLVNSIIDEKTTETANTQLLNEILNNMDVSAPLIAVGNG